MTTFAKVFSSIVTSSIWSEPHHVVRLWMTFLAIKDANGVIEGAVPGLARVANITVPECEEALQRFLNPDPYSRDLDRHPEREGRRIEKVPGGWRLLNADYYRDLPGGRELSQSPDAVRKRAARAVASGRDRTIGTNDDDGRTVSTSSSVSGSCSEKEPEQLQKPVGREGAPDEVTTFAATFAPFQASVEGLIRSARFAPAVMAILTTRYEGVPRTVLGEAVQEYIADQGGGVFNAAHFDGFVRRLKGRKAQGLAATHEQAGQQYKREEESAADDAAARRRRQVEQFEKECPAEYEELRLLANAAIPHDARGRAILVRARLFELIEEALDKH